MLYYFIEQAKDYFTDNAFILIANGVIGIARFFNTFGDQVFFQFPGLLLAIFLGVVFTQIESPFYWKRFKEQPLNTLQKCLNHELFSLTLKIYINLFMMLFFILALLTVLSVFIPEEGMHVRDRLTDENIVMAMGCFSIFVIVIAILKATFYSMTGFINSIGEFKLKMIIW